MASELKDLVESLDNKFVEYLSKDITNMEMQVDLKFWLGRQYYGSSNEHAKDCIEVCASVSHIYGRRIKPWTDNALKCFDNFLLKHIQDDRKEAVKKQGPRSKETDVYWHLIGLGGDLQVIGQCFAGIYQQRNEFQHIQVEEINGVRVPKRFSNSLCNQKRDLMIGWFKVALVKLLGIVGSFPK